MKLTIELAFECASEKEAASLEDALFPDNKSVPKDQEFESKRTGARLTFRIASERASGCISSAGGVLSDIKLFQEVWAATS